MLDILEVLEPDTYFHMFGCLFVYDWYKYLFLTFMTALGIKFFQKFITVKCQGSDKIYQYFGTFFIYYL